MGENGNSPGNFEKVEDAGEDVAKHLG